MSEILVREIVDGIGDSGVRCGLIGEVGCSSPLTDCERKSLQAAAIAQQKTGMSKLGLLHLEWLVLSLSSLFLSFP